MDNIDIRAGRYFTDFGQGFYVTSKYEQAETWAKNKFKDNISKFENLKPSIVKLTLDIEVLKQGRGLIIDSPSDKWAEFVYNCRKEGLYDKLFHDYDFVCGSLADGKIAPLIRLLMRGEISHHDFHQQIKPRKFEDQLSFHKPIALECIKEMEVFTIEKLTPPR